MYKKDLIFELSKKLSIDEPKAKSLIEHLGEIFAQTLARREKIVIPGFGVFVAKKRVPKRIVDPNHPSQMIQLPERYVTKFVAGQTLKRKINLAHQHATPAPLESAIVPPIKTEGPDHHLSTTSGVNPNNLPEAQPTSQPAQPPARPAYLPPSTKTPSTNLNQLVSELSQQSPGTTSPIPKKEEAPVKPSPLTNQAFPDLHGQTKPVTPPATPAGQGPSAFHPLPNQPTGGQASQPAIPTPASGFPPPAPASDSTDTTDKSAPDQTTPEKDKTEPTADIKKPAFQFPAHKPIPKVGAIHQQPSQVAYVDLKNKRIPSELLLKIPEYIARLYQAVPVDEKNGKLVVAMVDPEDFQAIEFIKKKIDQPIQPQIATQQDINRILEQYSGLEQEVETAIKGTEFAHIAEETKEEQEKSQSTEAPTSRVVQSILKKAVAKEASDVHIEPLEREVIVRFRVDGVLKKMISLPKTIQAGVVSRIKILSNIKIDEQRLPQDGRFQAYIEHKEIDFRVSTFPTIFGEKVVMRVLDKSVGLLSLEEIGLSGRGYDNLVNGIRKTHGMTLVTGPTGSGKTTSLYACLALLMDEGVNMVTLEDPVEYQIQGINQGQVRPDIGFTFASGLRSIVRQDPDIIMVGEIRDLETAEMAVQAALTGHIVLSTLHTNDAAGAIPRLVDMGVEPFLIISAINTIIAQRLARKICDHCKQPDQIPQALQVEIQKALNELPAFERSHITKPANQITFYKGRGCSDCNQTGYKGRVGIYEVLPVTDKLKDLVTKKVGGYQIQAQAQAEGMLTMKQDGILKAIQGKTSLEEIWRVNKE